MNKHAKASAAKPQTKRYRVIRRHTVDCTFFVQAFSKEEAVRLSEQVDPDLEETIDENLLLAEIYE